MRTSFVKPLIEGSTAILWQGIDRKVIDDSVNERCRWRAACVRRSAPYAVRQPALVRGLDRGRSSRRDRLHDLAGGRTMNDALSPYIVSLVTFAPLAGALLLAILPAAGS